VSKISRNAFSRLIKTAALTAFFTVALLPLLLVNGAAQAQSGDREVADSPLPEIRSGAAPETAVMAVSGATRFPTQEQLDFNVVYTGQQEPSVPEEA
jgi:hypothetical protein